MKRMDWEKASLKTKVRLRGSERMPSINDELPPKKIVVAMKSVLGKKSPNTKLANQIKELARQLSGMYSKRRSSMKNKILPLTISLFFSLSAFAGDKTVFLSETEVAKYAATIERVEAYLSRTQSIIADFTQVAPDGSLASGKFYLKRPGKMRWQYNPPTPVLMVATGTELIYYDYELEQISHIPLAGSLVSFLAQEKIQFRGDVGITQITSEAKVIRIEVAQKKNPTDGKLMLEFTDVPMQLRSMVITDSAGQVTNVALNDAKFNVDIDSELFKFMDPRKRKVR